MVTNTNSNTVGGRKFGGRNKKHTKRKSFKQTQVIFVAGAADTFHGYISN